MVRTTLIFSYTSSLLLLPGYAIKNFVLMLPSVGHCSNYIGRVRMKIIMFKTHGCNTFTSSLLLLSGYTSRNFVLSLLYSLRELMLPSIGHWINYIGRGTMKTLTFKTRTWYVHLLHYPNPRIHNCHFLLPLLVDWNSQVPTAPFWLRRELRSICPFSLY
jgi:hypothetical protein